MNSLRGWQYRIFGTLWGGYASYYLCRVNFAVAQKPIKEDFGWTDAQVGSIPSVYAAFYAFGQFVNGQLAERFGARVMMTVALAVALITNLLFSFTDSYEMMLVLWAANGYAQSAGWSLVVQTISNWTSVKRRGMVIGLISTCYQVGHVISWLLAGWLSADHGWRMAFLVPSLILVPMTAFVVLFLRNRPEDAGFEPVREDLVASKTSIAEDAGTLSAGQVLAMTLKNRVLWILGISYFCMNSVRYAYMNWAVQYMAEYHQADIDDSAFKAVALPLIGSVGAVAAGWASDALFGGRRAPLCAIMLFGLAGVSAMFVMIPQGDWVAGTSMLGLAGFLIYGPDMLMSGAATVDVHPRAAAAATGFTMCMGATGAIFSGAGVGWLKDEQAGQWDAIFYVLAGLAVVSAALMVSIWNARPKTSK